MDFYEEASLVMVPSGYKDQKVYSSVPDDGSGDLTFSRASTATRVNSDGYIEKAQVNLLLQSNTFNTTWLNQLGGTITGGQSGYDGTNDAWLLSKDTSTFRSIRQVISFAGVVTYSAYVKAGTLSNAALRVDSSAGALQVLYDLSAGTATLSGGANIAYGIDSIGSGWYRIFVTANISGGTNVHVYVDRDGTTAGNILIQDAQLNYGLVAQDYIETTTASVTEGVAIDVPRLNYDPVNPTSASLLLEPSRTNLINQSDYIASWAGANTTVVSNAGTSPEGVNNATSLTFASGGYWYKSVTISYTAGTAYTWSIYANTSAQVIKWGGATPAGTDTYTIEDAGNGWYRQIITRVVSGSGTTNFQPLMDWVNVGVGVEFKVYGGQLEASASYASSLIPTYGTSATRTADACYKTGVSSLIGQTAGTLFVETNTEYYESSNMNFALSDGSNTNNVKFIYERATSKWKAEVNNNGSPVAIIETGVIARGTRVKLAMAYANNDFVFYMNGSLIGTDPSGSTTFPVTLSKVSTDRGDGIAPLNGNLYQALVFKTRLSNASLSELTTL